MNSVSFSVIIPAYRAANTIVETLESVCAQTHLPLEILIFEDGQLDDIATRVAKFSEDAPCLVRLISRPVNAGVSRARNTLMREARGNIIAFMDADDIWRPDHLALAAEAFNSGADVVFSGVTFIDANGASIPGRGEPSPQDLANIAPALFRYNFVQCTSSLCLRRSWIHRVGDFDTRLSHGEDLDLWLRLVEAGAHWHYTGQCSCVYRKHATSAMGQTLLMVERMAAFYEKQLDNPLIPLEARRRAYINNRRHHARLNWRKRPDQALIALRRLMSLQPWHPGHLAAWLAVSAWASLPRHRTRVAV